MRLFVVMINLEEFHADDCLNIILVVVLCPFSALSIVGRLARAHAWIINYSVSHASLRPVTPATSLIILYRVEGERSPPCSLAKPCVVSLVLLFCGGRKQFGVLLPSSKENVLYPYHRITVVYGVLPRGLHIGVFKKKGFGGLGVCGWGFARCLPFCLGVGGLGV